MNKTKSKKKPIKSPSSKYSGILFICVALFVLIIANYAQKGLKENANNSESDSDLVSKVVNQLKINLNNMPKEEKTRAAAVAGGFYPEEKKDLDLVVNDYLAQAEFKNIDNIKALIAPHAGYIYSGQIAGQAYTQIKDYSNINKVFILGPSHYEQLSGAGLSSADYFQTPLGKIKLSDINSKLKDEENFEINDDAQENA